MAEQRTNREAFEAMIEATHGEHSQFGGFETWGKDGSTASPPEPSTTVEHRYGSDEYSFVDFDADGTVIGEYVVALARPDMPTRVDDDEPAAA